MHRVVTAEQLEPVELREVDSFEGKEEFENNLSLWFEWDNIWLRRSVLIKGEIWRPTSAMDAPYIRTV